MKVHASVYKDSGLIHSVVVTAANVHDLTSAADRLHGEERVVYGDSGHSGIDKRPEKEGRGIGFRIAMRPGKRRALPNTPEGRLQNVLETEKRTYAPRRNIPFESSNFNSVSRRYYWGIKKNDHKLTMLFALANLYTV